MNVAVRDDRSAESRVIKRELGGIVTNYDQKRHRWFVKPDDPRLGDILLSSEVLGAFGRSRLSLRVRVEGQVITSDPTGLRFHQIRSIGENEPPIPTRRKEEPIEQIGGPVVLCLKWFDAGKGYGFFLNSDPGGRDIFVHQSIFEAAGLKTDFGEGARFVVTWGKNPKKGLTALTVAPS